MGAKFLSHTEYKAQTCHSAKRMSKSNATVKRTSGVFRSICDCLHGWGFATFCQNKNVYVAYVCECKITTERYLRIKDIYPDASFPANQAGATGIATVYSRLGVRSRSAKRHYTTVGIRRQRIYYDCHQFVSVSKDSVRQTCHIGRDLCICGYWRCWW